MSECQWQSASEAPWLLLSLLPRFGLKLRERIAAHTDELTDLLSMNPATLRAMGLGADAVEAVTAWQIGDAGQPVLAKAGRIYAQCQQQGMELVGQGHDHFPDALKQILSLIHI